MPAERTMVPGYRHVPGNHCGSTALRNLLAFHGLELSEEMALGLGAGISFYYVALGGSAPSRFTNGRTGRLEGLTRARHGDHPVFPLAGHMFTVPQGSELRDLSAAAPAAIARCAR